LNQNRVIFQNRLIYGLFKLADLRGDIVILLGKEVACAPQRCTGVGAQG